MTTYERYCIELLQLKEALKEKVKKEAIKEVVTATFASDDTPKQQTKINIEITNKNR